MKNRAERITQAKRVINKRLKVIKSISPDYKKVIEQPHRMAKKHPLDCGNPKCGLCHSEKNLKKPKISDLRHIPLEEIDDNGIKQIWP